jgi:hypothetical protein
VVRAAFHNFSCLLIGKPTIKAPPIPDLLARPTTLSLLFRRVRSAPFGDHPDHSFLFDVSPYNDLIVLASRR